MEVKLIGIVDQSLYDVCPKVYIRKGITPKKEYFILKIRATKHDRFVLFINDDGELVEFESGMFQYKII